jgi:thiol:disulfide interchange protein DsbD
MIPITVGYFGNRHSESWNSRILDAMLYLMGMALIYTMLGAMAALTGQMLGRALQSPLIQGTLALVMVIMAASMFGLFELSFSSSVESQLRNLADGLGTFGMGMTLGVAAAPCLAPSTVALIGYVGQQESLFQGAFLFFVLSLGLGVPYVILALFTGLIDYLPDSGEWFGWIERLLGHLLLGVALYFLWPLVSPELLGYLVIVWIFVAVLDLSLRQIPSDRRLAVGRSLMLLILGGFLLYWLVFGLLWTNPKLNWVKGTTFVKKRTVEMPTVVYTGADWCIPCKEMNVTTFQSLRVKRSAEGVKLVKIDMTTTPPEPVSKWISRHNLVGVPTMVFLKPGGSELKELRAEGYVSASKFSNLLNRLKEASTKNNFLENPL